MPNVPGGRTGRHLRLLEVRTDFWQWIRRHLGFPEELYDNITISQTRHFCTTSFFYHSHIQGYDRTKGTPRTATNRTSAQLHLFCLFPFSVSRSRIEMAICQSRFLDGAGRSDLDKGRKAAALNKDLMGLHTSCK